MWAECRFADPISDLAVLDSPDNQALDKQADAYEALTESAEPLAVNPLVTEGREEQRVRLLSPDGSWFDAVVAHAGRHWYLLRCNGLITPGMSGSPIVDDNGLAVGLVSSSGEIGGTFGSAFMARLCWQLPVGLLSAMAALTP
jgi:hypothetical protein